MLGGGCQHAEQDATPTHHAGERGSDVTHMHPCWAQWKFYIGFGGKGDEERKVHTGMHVFGNFNQLV